MAKTGIAVFVSLCIILFSASAMAQFPVLSAEQVRSWMDGKKKVLLIDARPAVEYQQGHIPGAVNIMPDHMKTASERLPKDKAAPIIFYCRGVE